MHPNISAINTSDSNPVRDFNVVPDGQNSRYSQIAKAINGIAIMNKIIIYFLICPNIIYHFLS